MAEQKIERRQVFEGEKLPEGYGVVVTCRDGQEVAYGDARKIPHEQDTLYKNFVGAKFLYGADKVSLIRKENGLLIRQ